MKGDVGLPYACGKTDKTDLGIEHVFGLARCGSRRHGRSQMLADKKGRRHKEREKENRSIVLLPLQPPRVENNTAHTATTQPRPKCKICRDSVML